ncbi:restriction endonuclease subunit S [Dialister invisus]|uniref:restriction endonuclease subunit S n=1 Tax=Dialister invisus TaxID=218538 RepID=UPI0030784014
MKIVPENSPIKVIALFCFNSLSLFLNPSISKKATYFIFYFLHNKVNNNLEQQAQAIYKSWFIDFDPFDGLMPSNWNIGKIADIIELYDAKRIPLSSRERAERQGMYPYYGATSVMDYVDDYLFDGIYLLLGEDGTVADAKGYPILQYVDGKFWVNNHAHIIRGKNNFSVELLYTLFSLTNVQSIITGAVQPKISQQSLKNVEIIIPDEKALLEIDSIVQPLFAEIRNRKAEIKSLTELRDSLLPKLMSGELNVSAIDI